MSSTLKASSLQNLDQEFFGSKRAIPEPILEGIQQQQPSSSSTIVNNNNNRNNLLLQHQKQNKRSASTVSASSAASSTVSCDSSSASPVLEFTLPSQQRKRELLQQQQKEKKENEHQKQQQKERVQSSSSTSKLVQLLQQNTTTSSTSNTSPITVPPHRVFNLKNSNNNSNSNNSLGTRSGNNVVDLLLQASAAANAIAISSSTTTSTAATPSPSAVVYNPLASDWRTLSITSNISKFEPTLISRLQAWKKNYGISSTILQVTAPNACGIVRLFPVVPTTANSSSSVSSSANQQQQQATAISSSVSAASLMTVVSKQNAAWSAALPPSFGIFSEINKKIQQEKQQTQTQQPQQAATFAPLAPIDLPACANLSRSIVAVIMSTLDVCTRLEMSVLRVICHDFSEFSHPSTLHNSNNTAMLISMFENVVSPSTTQTTQQEVQQQNNNKISYSEKVLRGPSTFTSSSTMTSESKEPATFKSLQLGSYPIADFYSADGSRAPITTRTNNNFGSVGNLNKVVASSSQDFSNNNQQQNLVGAISSVASAILLSDNNNNNGKQQKYQNHNIYFSKIDAFFSVPVVSPFLLYSQHKPQHYVMEHQKSGLENNNSKQNNVAIYKVMDLVHDNRALQSLIYPEQWIYSLCYFVAEVLMLFDGRDTPCRIRHAEKAISVFPSFVFAAFENNGSGTSAYQQSLTISSFSELRQALYEVANLELFPHQGDKKALQSRIPPRRHDSENENSNTTINSNVEHAHHSEDTVARFIFFVYERLRLVQKGKYLKLANFLRSICEMPLGVIPIARSSTTTTSKQQQNNNAASFVTSSENAPRDPPVATPSQIGGAESLFYGFHRRGLTCAETSLHHHHFVNRVAYRSMMNNNNTSTTAIATSAVSTRLLPPPPQYQQQPFRGVDSTTTPPYQPVLKLSDEQSQELKRWKMIHGVTNCVIHVYGNEHKKVIYLTPITSCLNEDDQVKEAAPSSEASPVAAASISWTINQQQHQQQNSSSRSVTADYLTAAMTIAENEAQAPCLRIIFHNLWAFRDAKLTIADFTPEDPFFVAYVMSAVKNTDRLIDLLFINNNYQQQQQQNETSVDSSITSNDSNKTQNSGSSQQQNQNQQQPLVIAENHWIGGMLKFLRSCLKFLKNFNANKENLEKNLDEAMRLLHNFRSPLLNLVELKTGLMSFVSFMLSSSSSCGNNDLASYFDNSESILDWLSSLLSAITFLQEMNERKMKDKKENSSTIDFPVLIKTIRFLITVCVLPMRPTQHQVFEADERGRKIVADAAADTPNTTETQEHQKNNKSNKTYEEKNKKHENSRTTKSVSQQNNNSKNNAEMQNNNNVKSGTTRRGGHRRGSKQ